MGRGSVADYTSRSAITSYQACPRRRWLQYEMPNGTPTAGWERRRVAIAPTVGIYVHRGIEKLLTGTDATAASLHAQEEFLKECASRGLEAEQGCDEAGAVKELAALVRALVLAWARLRLPRWQADYETVEVEKEDRIALSDDVTLATRSDWIVRRKSDLRLFVVNFKTVATADDRWYKQWEIDAQLLLELLAAEQRLGEECAGVIIEGLVKGRRMKEEDSTGAVTGYRETSKLIYGYKLAADPPLVQAAYDWAYTRKKGWARFSVWEEQAFGADPLAYWVNWLPEEVLETCFAVVPPIARSADAIEHVRTQLVNIEERVAIANTNVLCPQGPVGHLLDVYYPQNFHSCLYPSRCQFWQACHEPIGAIADSGLYQPRTDHHALAAEGE